MTQKTGFQSLLLLILFVEYILSCQTAGIRDNSLIINLPGKPRAIGECLDGVYPAIPYCLDLIGAPYMEFTAKGSNAFRPG